MDLQSATVGKIATALAKAQGEFPPIPKDKTAKVNMKGGGSYSYKYTDYNSVRAAVLPVLTKNGLSYSHQGTPEGGIATTLMHESGEWLRSCLPVYQGQNGGSQGYGSGKTYAERYGLCGILGVSADEDADGREASGEGSEKAPPPRTVEPPFDADAALKSLESTLFDTKDLDGWWKANKPEIGALKNADMKKYGVLEDRIKTRRSFLSQAPDKSLVDDEIKY